MLVGPFGVEFPDKELDPELFDFEFFFFGCRPVSLEDVVPFGVEVLSELIDLFSDSGVESVDGTGLKAGIGLIFEPSFF